MVQDRVMQDSVVQDRVAWVCPEASRLRDTSERERETERQKVRERETESVERKCVCESDRK